MDSITVTLYRANTHVLHKECLDEIRTKIEGVTFHESWSKEVMELITEGYTHTNNPDKLFLELEVLSEMFQVTFTGFEPLNATDFIVQYRDKQYFPNYQEHIKEVDRFEIINEEFGKMTIEDVIKQTETRYKSVDHYKGISISVVGNKLVGFREVDGSLSELFRFNLDNIKSPNILFSCIDGIIDMLEPAFNGV